MLEIQRCHEAILLSPLNLSPSLIPLLLPAHSFFPVFSPGPEPERDGPAEENPRRCPTFSLKPPRYPDINTRTRRLVFGRLPSQTQPGADWLTRTYTLMDAGGGGEMHTQKYTHISWKASTHQNQMPIFS